MQKLIELLNECTNGRFKTEQDLRLCIEMRGYCRDFIKWLVENDKIDLVKFSDKLSNSNGTMEDRYRYLNSDFGLYHTLLMLLSISDTPIEDLCGYLKDDATEKVDTLLKGIKKSCESLGI